MTDELIPEDRQIVVNRDFVIRELLTVYARVKEAKSRSALPTAVKALELLGRSIGMFNTTYHVTPTTEKYIDVIPEETNARIQKLIKFAQDKFDNDPDK